MLYRGKEIKTVKRKEESPCIRRKRMIYFRPSEHLKVCRE